MKRLLAVALLCAIALTFASTASAITGYTYRTTQNLEFCTGCAAVTGQTDSTALYLSDTATVDTSWTYPWPADIAWSAVSDSIPIQVVVTRSGVGTSTDSIEVALQCKTGGATGYSAAGIAGFIAAPTYWDDGGLAHVGATYGGYAVFIPTRAYTNKMGPINTYIVPARSWGSDAFRVLVRKIGATQSGNTYSVKVRYPVFVK